MIAPEPADRFAAAELPLDAVVLLAVVDRDAAGLLAADGLRCVEGLRGVEGLPDAEALVDVRLVAPEDADEEALGDFAPDAGDFCFVATGVRDSLVALSARQKKGYRPSAPDAGIRAGFLLGLPDPR